MSEETKIETPTETTPVFRLYGSGRDARTRDARRADRFRKKSPRIGEVSIRPGRRVEVGLGFVRAHFEEIVGHIRRGALRVESSSDRFVDPEELRAIIEGRIQVSSFEEETSGGGSEESLEEMSTALKEISDSIATLEAEAESVASITDSEDARILEEMKSPTEKEPQVVTPADVDDTLLDGLAASLAVPAVTPPAAPKVVLPEAWRSRNQKDLLALCKELSIEADKNMSKAAIIALIADWEKRTSA